MEREGCVESDRDESAERECREGFPLRGRGAVRRKRDEARVDGEKRDFLLSDGRRKEGERES